MEVYGFALPLWHFLLSITFVTFGVSVLDTLAMESAVGLLTVFLVYVLAREMYGRLTAALSALSLTTLLLFAVLVRSGSGFAALIPLVLLTTLCFVYIAHKRMDPRYLWMAGVAMGIAFFNAYPSDFLVVPIVVLFLLWNVDLGALLRKRTSGKQHAQPLSARNQLSFIFKNLFRRFLRAQDYALFVAIAIETFVLATIGFDEYVGQSPLTTIRLIDEHWLSQPSLVTNTLTVKQDLILVLSANTRRFFGDMFVSINPGVDSFGPHTQQFLAGVPYVAPFVSVFLVVGLATSIKRRSAADKMCLCWFAVCVLAVTIFSGFNARGAIMLAPAIALMSASGMVAFIDFFKGRRWKIFTFPRLPEMTKVAAILVICFGIVFTTYTSYENVFQVYYGQEDGRIASYYGMSGVYQYILDHSDPKSAEIVLGDSTLLPYDAFAFYTGGAYSFMYWQDSIGPESTKVIQNLSALDHWEQRTLQTHNKIFYVFGLGGRYTEQPGWDVSVGLDQSVTYFGSPSIIQGTSNGLPWFRELHPSLPPAQTVYFNDGTPAFEIFSVDNMTPRSGSIYLARGLNYVSTESQSSINFLTVKGPASNFAITSNNQSLSFPFGLLPSETESVTWNNESQILFEPMIQSSNYTTDVFQQQNLRFNKTSTSSWIQLDGESGYVIYKMESPFGNITSVTIQTNPRLYNDPAEKNSVSLSYSVDNHKYNMVYSLRSNGDGSWSYYFNPYTFDSPAPVPFQPNSNASSAIFERQTYNEIHPDSKVVYLKFALTGQAGEAQLWSHPGPNRMYFIGQFDSSTAPRLTLSPGVNKVSLQASDSPIVSIAATSTLGVRIPEVSCWKLDDGQRTIAADSCGKNPGALVNSPTWLSNSSCLFSGCLKFVGPAQKVLLNPNSGLPTSAITVALWARVTGHSSADVLIQDTWASNKGSWVVYGDATNWVFGMQDGLGAIHFIEVPHLNSKSWNYLVGTWTGSTMTFYVNGTQVGTATTATTTLLQSSLQLGPSNGGSTLYEEDVRIFSAALSPDQINQQYSSHFLNQTG